MSDYCIDIDDIATSQAGDARKSTAEKFYGSLKPGLPMEEMREDGTYFYLESIEEYLGNAWVKVRGRGEMLLFGGYSYLGLNRHPKINEAAVAAIVHYGTGGHGARLLAGSLEVHRELENNIARFKKTESAATFSSGFFANVSAITYLVGRGDIVICDKLNHASILDGCMTSGARMIRFRHNDMDHLESCLRETADHKGRKLVIVDAVYSMDGDIANLPDISALCRKYGALLMVDEAHSIGVLGATGHGIEEHFGLPPDTVDIKMGTLSKAIPSMGGYIAGSARFCDLLRHSARGFIYSAALPPAVAAAASAGIQVIEEEPWHVQALHRNTTYFAGQLNKENFPFLNSVTPIIPIVFGDNGRTGAMAKNCQSRGLYVQAIPHPVVPEGTARLRASVNASHTLEDLDLALKILKESRAIVTGQA
jgi:glycine C-acetyltransferase